MNFRHDTYTGGEHYWIRYREGRHEVRRETPECYDDHETVFVGSYEAALKYLEELRAANADYDLNL